MEARTINRQFYISALQNGQFDAVKLCLECGLSPNLRVDTEVNTPSHIAAKKNYLDLLKLLISFGANVTLTNIHQRDVIQCAADSDSWPCYEYLMTPNKAPAPLPWTKRQLIVHAAKTNNLVALDRLLQPGTNANFVVDKDPGIFFAIKTRNLPLLQLLVAKGARTDISHANMKALDMAIDTRDTQFVDALLGRGTPMPKPSIVLPEIERKQQQNAEPVEVKEVKQPVEVVEKKEIEEKKVEQPVVPPVVVQPVKPAPLVPLSVFSQPPAPPKDAMQNGVPTRDQIIELLEDSLTLDTLDEPVIHFDGITYSKASALTFKKDPADVTQDFRMEETIPNLLVAELLTYLNNPNVDLSKTPPCLICPETKELFKAPVVADDGKTYEQAWLDKYLRGHRNILPNSEIKQSRLPFKNIVLEKVIEKFMVAPAQDAPLENSVGDSRPKKQ